MSSKKISSFEKEIRLLSQQLDSDEIMLLGRLKGYNKKRLKKLRDKII